MVFIEAMSSGLPIVTYDTGAIREVVQNAGFIMKENDLHGLADSLLRIIGVKDLREKIGTIGRERAEKYFDSKKTRNKIYELYTQLTTSH
jgi:glycosyltransferase involved in cell wall biosynthesis